MYVCSCKAVTDTQISQAVQEGVRSMRQLSKQTGCSSNCGRCAPTAAQVLREALETLPPGLAVVPGGRTA
jgi:bacterioferritin-associated ferredoxin